MNCSRCHNPLGEDQFCTTCGLKHDYLKKACNTANYYYNAGLAKAGVRDLSGAKEDLKKALFYNKYHIEARNLLGLIYYETGEVVEALQQWVISINFVEEDNPAQRYLTEIQEDNYLEVVRQVTKKYNLAVQYAQQGSEDLAMIQAKKVISIMPKFVNARLLLALLFLRAGKAEEAKKCLERVLKIDAFHPDAIRYYKELTGERPAIVKSKKVQQDSKPVEEKKARREDLDKYIDSGSGNRNLIISLIIGIVIGVVAMWVLIIPNERFNVSSDYKELQVEYKDTVAAKDAAISQLESDKTALEKENKSLSAKLEVYTGKDGKGGMYDAILKASQHYAKGDKIEAAKALLKVDSKKLESSTAKSLYKTMKDETFLSSAKTLYSQGYSDYSRYRYKEAKEALALSVKLNPNDENALYFFARTYHQLNDKDKAVDTYKKVIDKFPDTRRATESINRLSQLGVKYEAPKS